MSRSVQNTKASVLQHYPTFLTKIEKIFGVSKEIFADWLNKYTLATDGLSDPDEVYIETRDCEVSMVFDEEGNLMIDFEDPDGFHGAYAVVWTPTGIECEGKAPEIYQELVAEVTKGLEVIGFPSRMPTFASGFGDIAFIFSG